MPSDKSGNRPAGTAEGIIAALVLTLLGARFRVIMSEVGATR